MSVRTAPALVLLLCAAGVDTARGSSEPGLWSAGETSIRSSASGYLLATAGGERPFALPSGVTIEGLFALRPAAFLSARGAGSDRGELYLATVDGAGVHPLAAPARVAGVVRENAVPLASVQGDLEGLAWLEGTDRQSYAIRYAAWDGVRWSAPMAVAPAAPGSQLALAGVTLSDGSQLLVWSRFDGHDDEIVAARRAAGEWSVALPIAADNAVPDITPTVVAVPGGALASWSRYDGHQYRLVISRFDGQAWNPPAWAGEAGSTDPNLTRSAGRLWLTFADAQPRGWGVLELDATGSVLRRGSAATLIGARPALSAFPSGDVRLKWATTQTAVAMQ